jgi:hypothetical protein
MKEFYNKDCQRINVDKEEMLMCLNKQQWYRFIGASPVNTVDEIVKSYGKYCDETFDPVDGATDRFICNILTGNQKYN